MLRWDAVCIDCADAEEMAPNQPPDRADDLRVMLDPAGHPFCLYLDEA